MKVLSVEELRNKLSQKSNTCSDLQNASTNNKLHTGIHTEPNSEISLEINAEQDSKRDEQKAIEKYFLGLLSRREYSYQELQKKLKAKPYSYALGETVLAKFIKKNLQSDRRFSQMFIRSRIAKSTGPFKLRMELKQRGIATYIIEQEMNQVDCDWFELALALAKKKTASWKNFSAPEKSKLMRFLQGRGFEQEHIRHVLEALTRGY